MLSEFDRGLAPGSEIGEIQFVVPSRGVHGGYEVFEGVAVSSEIIVAFAVGRVGSVGIRPCHGVRHRCAIAPKEPSRLAAPVPSRQRHEGIHHTLVLDEILAYFEDLGGGEGRNVDVYVESHGFVDGETGRYGGHALEDGVGAGEASGAAEDGGY